MGADRTSSEGREGGRRLITVALLAARVVILVIGLSALGRREIEDPDVLRFREIAMEPGRPYRDFAVEYAPLETLVARAIGTEDVVETARRLMVAAFALDLLTASALGRVWGPRCARVYLLLGLPLLTFMYLRLTLLSTAAAAIAAALFHRARERSGAAALGAAALAKLWPVVLVPGVYIRGQGRALRWTMALLIVGSGLWLLWGGPAGPLQVVTFRGAEGWHAESTVGVVVWILTGGPVALEAGAPRVGSAPPWAQAALGVAASIAVTAVWIRARASSADAFGAPAAAAVGALLFFSPLFSLQFAAWLLPWAAIAAARGDRPVAAVVFVVSLLTGALFTLYVEGLPTRAPFLAQALILVRNGLVGTVAGLWLARRRAMPP